VGLTTSSIAQVGTSLEKKMTEEEPRSFATAAPRLSSSCGRLKGK